MVNQCYVIDLYVNGKRYDYFPPHGYSLTDRLDQINEWTMGQGIKDYKIVVKELNYWIIYKLNLDTNRFDQIRKIYLVQIDTLAEIEERFEGDRIA